MSKLYSDLFLATNCKWLNVGANNSQDAVWIIKIINFIAGWELLKDPSGRDHFLSFLEKEYATENLLFVESVWHLKKLPVSEVRWTTRKRFWISVNIVGGWAVQHHLGPVHGHAGWAPRQCRLQVIQNHSGEHEQSRQVLKLFAILNLHHMLLDLHKISLNIRVSGGLLTLHVPTCFT